MAALLAVAWAGPAAAEETGRLRVAHLSPDSPAVDVALTPAPASGPAVDPGDDVAAGLTYGEVGEYRDLAPGGYALSIRPAGAPATTPPVLSTRVDVPAGGARTVVVGGRFAALALTALPDDLTPPAPGSARVRVLAAAGTAAELDAEVLGGPALAADLPFAAAGSWTEVPAGSRTVRVTSGAESAATDVELRGGSVLTVLALDHPDGSGLVVRAVLDASAPEVVPAGGVEAGGGGAAPPVVLACGALLGAAAVRARRHPARLVAAVALGAALLPAPAPPASAAVVPDVAEARPSGAAATTAPPVRVRAPGVGLDAAVTPTGLDAAGALAVPADPTVAGWYAAGPAPGDRGPAVLAGHVDWAGRPTVFADLDRLGPGDAVLVDRADGTTARFVVTAVDRYAKDAFPTATVYGASPDAELRLITCGGAFDRAAGSYTENVVVTARAG